jgi:hypothetical protein
MTLRLHPAALAGRLPRRTVRLRLTALYGALFLASGTGLLAITNILARSWPWPRSANSPSPPPRTPPRPVPPARCASPPPPPAS